MRPGTLNTNYRHGHSPDGQSSPTYNSWRGMVERCTNPNHQYYKNYGGLGVAFDPRWATFDNFLDDMGERPEGTTLDRWPNKSGDYHLGNCRWATRKDQQRNRQDNRRVQCYAGQHGTKTVAEWADISGTPYTTIIYRLNKMWPGKQAVFGRAK